MEAPSRLCMLLRELREESGLSSRKFASRIGVSRETYRQYEAGISLPSNQSLLKILRGSGLDPEKDDSAKRLIAALCDERSLRPPGEVCASGVSANKALHSYITTENISEDRIDRLVDLFFEHLPTDRSESMEHFLKTSIQKILEA